MTVLIIIGDPLKSYLKIKGMVAGWFKFGRVEVVNGCAVRVFD